jgi:hypothetical protein
MSAMLVEAFSNQLVSNMNPMNQATGNHQAKMSHGFFFESAIHVYSHVGNT